MGLFLTESWHDHSAGILLDIAWLLCLGETQIRNCDGPNWIGFTYSRHKTTAKDRHMQLGFKGRKPTGIYAKAEHANLAIESEVFFWL